VALLRPCRDYFRAVNYEAGLALRRRDERASPAQPSMAIPVIAMTIDGGAGTVPPVCPPAAITVSGPVPKDKDTSLTVVPVGIVMPVMVIVALPR
jgi:hypothetical protein